MAEILKQKDKAFVLDRDKASEFFTKKVNTSSDAIRRFTERDNNKEEPKK